MRGTGIVAERQREQGGPRGEEGEMKSESETTGQAVFRGIYFEAYSGCGGFFLGNVMMTTCVWV